LLATQFTMEDGFFAAILEKNGIQVTIPEVNDRQKIENILESAMQNQVTTEARNYFAALTHQYADCESVVLGCTECPLVLDEKNSCLPIINPIVLSRLLMQWLMQWTNMRLILINRLLIHF